MLILNNCESCKCCEECCKCVSDSVISDSEFLFLSILICCFFVACLIIDFIERYYL